MSKSHPPSPIYESDYQAIEKAMLETARGRWFLNEFMARNRASDTQTLLDAIAKLESSIQRDKTPAEHDKLHMDLMEMSHAIAKTKQEIAALLPNEEDDNPHIESATQELDAIVQATEKATNLILTAAEEIQESAWVLREAKSDAAICDALDNKATEIYTACSFQDITGQRTSKVVHLLRYLEQRLEIMLEIWSDKHQEQTKSAPASSQQNQIAPPGQDPLLNGPQLQGKGLEQTDVDSIFVPPPGEDVTPTAHAGAEQMEPKHSESASSENTQFNQSEVTKSDVDQANALLGFQPPEEEGASEQSEKNAASEDENDANIVAAEDFDQPEPKDLSSLSSTQKMALFN